jgi:hypothetical protein
MKSIKELPKDIKKLAKKRRKEQGGKSERLISVECFLWELTEEGWDFWNQINNGDFDVFYGEKATDLEVIHEVVNGGKINEDIVSVKSDSIVESVIKKFKDRSDVGIKKYGTTLDRKDINFDGWAEHLQQELMDGILYLERLRKDFKL